MAKPTRDDAEMLIRIGQLGTQNHVTEAIGWLFTSEPITDYRTFVAKNPAGSENYEKCRRIAIHFEMVGTFVKHGLLNEDLTYDLLLVPWDRMKAFVLGTREEAKEPRLGENFEWLGIHQEMWAKTHPPLNLVAATSGQAARPEVHS